jgi:hypothetical protein
MWTQNVAVLLVEQAGLGQYLVAKGEDDAVAKATFWLLNQTIIQAASKHLEQSADEQSGYFDRQQGWKDLESAFELGFEEVVRANGNRADMRDIDIRNGYRPAVCRAFIPPGFAPWYVMSETAETQFERLMKQAAISKLSWKGLEFLFRHLVAAHHGLGFRGMHIIGHGSSVVCIKTTYRGDSITGAAQNGQELVVKANHFKDRRPRQENRMKNDSIPTALHLHHAAGARRGTAAGSILPKPLGVYPGGCAAGFVRYDGRNSAVCSSVRDRPVLCFGAFEFIPEGSLHNSEIVKRVVEQYSAEGVVSNEMIRVVQALIHATYVMNRLGCFCMDISWGNLAVSYMRGDRLNVTWLDTGGGMVLSDARCNAAPPLMRASTSFAAGPDAGPVQGKPTPLLPVCKQTKTKNSSIGYLSDTTMRALFASDSGSRTCSGTPGYRDEGMVTELDAPENRKKPLTVAIAKRWDYASTSKTAIQLLHRAPRPAAQRERWEKDLLVATGSKEAMLNFLLQGIKDPVARGKALHNDTLNNFADLFYKSLREEGRIGALEALVSKALSSKVWSTSQMQDLKGDGIRLQGGGLICPAGWSEAEWNASKWAAFQHPPLTLREELNGDGVSMGVGVQTPNAFGKDEFIGLYAGTEASSFTRISPDDVPPCRYTAFARDKRGAEGARLHVIAEQPVEWFLERRVVGPFLNGVMGNERCNVYLQRDEFFRSKDGILYMAMYAARGVAAGEFLRWRYDPTAGGGGADSYFFPLD